MKKLIIELIFLILLTSLVGCENKSEVVDKIVIRGTEIEVGEDKNEFVVKESKEVTRIESNHDGEVEIYNPGVSTNFPILWRRENKINREKTISMDTDYYRELSHYYSGVKKIIDEEGLDVGNLYVSDTGCKFDKLIGFITNVKEGKGISSISCRFECSDRYGTPPDYPKYIVTSAIINLDENEGKSFELEGSIIEKFGEIFKDNIALYTKMKEDIRSYYNGGLDNLFKYNSYKFNYIISIEDDYIVYTVKTNFLDGDI